MTTPNRPPLWREIDDAWWSLLVDLNEPPNPPPNDQAACVIRAVQKWLLPEEPEPQSHLVDGDCNPRWDEWHARQRLRALLITEADRAERGDG